MAGGLDFAKFLDPLGLFHKDKKPNTPSPAAVPVSPTEDIAARQARETAAEEERRRAAGGRASTMLTQGTGETGSASKMLLGA